MINLLNLYYIKSNAHKLALGYRWENSVVVLFSMKNFYIILFQIFYIYIYVFSCEFLTCERGVLS